MARCQDPIRSEQQEEQQHIHGDEHYKERCQKHSGPPTHPLRIATTQAWEQLKLESSALDRWRGPSQVEVITPNAVASPCISDSVRGLGRMVTDGQPKLLCEFGN